MSDTLLSRSGRAAVSKAALLILVITSVLIWVPTAEAQEQSRVQLSGRVVDADTGEPLPAANIQVKDTFRGTITNDQGFYELAVPGLPAVLQFRYIGYESREVVFDEGETDQIVRLQPSALELDELVFTGEDPAMHIMERVIARKQIWRENLDSWKADAYTRSTLSNEDGIVTIQESLSETWWKLGRGFREYIVDQRQTSNVMADQNFAGTSYLPNFYDDEIEIAGFRIIGVTHPDAFRYYDFRIADRRYLDDQIVYDIKVIPKTRLQPVFEGQVSVLGETYAMIEVDLVPGEMVFFPPPVQEVDLSYRQQFSNYGGDFWLPADVRIDGKIEVGLPGFRIPQIKFNLVSSITNYEINPAVPDTVFGRSRARISFSRLDEAQRERIGRSFELQSETIPLTETERDAYDTIDSTKSVEDAFRPTGILARMAGSGNQGGNSGSGFWNRLDINPDLRFNRVEAFYGGMKPEFRISDSFSVDGKIGHSSARERLSYGGGFRFSGPDANRRGRLRVFYDYDVRERIHSLNYTTVLAAGNMLFGNPDYYDYYRRERVSATYSYAFREPLTGLWMRPGLMVYTERQQNLDSRTNYSFRGGVVQRPNPGIEEGRLSAAGLWVQLGAAPTPFGIAGGNSALLRIDHSREGTGGSNFSFTRYEARVDLRIETFLKRRFLSNALDVRLEGFTHTGELPVQAFGGFDSQLGSFTPFGSFKTIQNRILEGEHGAAVFMEHNFRTVPFELLGMRRVVDWGLSIIVHGASGRTWLDQERIETLNFVPFYEDRWRHEAGVSLNGIFGLFRFDTAWRLDRPGFYAGFSAARVF